MFDTITAIYIHRAVPLTSRGAILRTPPHHRDFAAKKILTKLP